MKSSLEKNDIPLHEKESYEQRLKEEEDEYSKISVEKNRTLKSYEVKLECSVINYGGENILGRYSFNYVLLGKDMNPVDYSANKLYISEIK